MMKGGIRSPAVVVRPPVVVGATAVRNNTVSTTTLLREKEKQPPSHARHHLSYPVISKEDFGNFREYSVIHTDRSLNLMSDPFQRVMRDLNQLLKVTYNADQVAIIPGYVFSVVFKSNFFGNI